MTTQPSAHAVQAASHQEAIEALANDTDLTFDEVRQVYEAELADLKAWARVSDFVALFAARRTRDRLRQR